MSNEKNTQAELETLRLPELQTRFLEVTGRANRSPNRTFLIRTIVEAVASGQIKVRPDEVVTELQAPPAAAIPPAEEARDEQSGAESQQPSADLAPAPEGADATRTDCDGCPICDEPAEGNEALSPAPTAAPSEEKKPRGRFSGMSLEALQAEYVRVVGRSTSSDNVPYLQWKIREAEKGRITVGPRQAKTTEAAADNAKTLPLRLEGPAVSAMDTAWRDMGIPSRTEFLRRAIGHYLTHLGATDAATLFATK